jgi:hypothetical protein
MKPKKTITKMDYLKASRRGSREAELENSTGWKSSHKIHKSENIYNRKQKHKKAINTDGFSFHRKTNYNF